MEAPSQQTMMARTLQAQQAQARVQRQSKEKTTGMEEAPAGLQPLIEQGLLSQELLNELRPQTEHLAQRIRAAKTLAEFSAVRQETGRLREKLAGIALGGRERQMLEEFREQFWRGIRIGGPGTDDATAGATFGLGTVISYIVWIIQALKGIRFRGQQEPLTVAAIFTPPPMPLSVAAKDAGKLLKTILTICVDAAGFIYNNINAAIVVVLIVLLLILMIAAYCTYEILAIVNTPICRDMLSLIAAIK